METKDWEKFWKTIPKPVDTLYRFYIWNQYKKFLNQISKKNIKILELGCGYGLNSLKILKTYGGEATLVDSLNFAIEKAKIFFSKYDYRVLFLNKDVFDLNINREYDVVFSEGLIEHFYGAEREQLIKIHLNATKKEGHVMIFFPTKSRIYNWFIAFLDLIGVKIDEEPVLPDDFKHFINQHNAEIIMETNFSIYWKGYLIQVH